MWDKDETLCSVAKESTSARVFKPMYRIVPGPCCFVGTLKHRVASDGAEKRGPKPSLSNSVVV